jgi:hypothetical protein
MECEGKVKIQLHHPCYFQPQIYDWGGNSGGFIVQHNKHRAVNWQGLWRLHLESFFIQIESVAANLFLRPEEQ